MTYHYYEIKNGPTAENYVQGILYFAEGLGVWATSEVGPFFTLVIVEPITEDHSKMLDLLFGFCEKY